MSNLLHSKIIERIVLTEKGEASEGNIGYYQHTVGAKVSGGTITHIQYDDGWFVIFVNEEPMELINARLVMSVILKKDRPDPTMA